MSIPAWIADLKDFALKADFTAIYNSATINEADVLKAMTDLETEISSLALPGLTADQFADLQSIAENIHLLGASPYLQFIVGAFVGQNSANSEWTGGGAGSTPLGYLSPGASLTQLTRLVDKWFLGSDLPSDVFYLYSASGTSVTATYDFTYQAVNAPLYNPATEAPSVLDVNQGGLGDCYLMASLAEVAQQNPLLIENMITDDGNGIYGVRFFGYDGPEYVTVNNELADGGTLFNRASNIWASVVESAFAQIQDQGSLTGVNGSSYGGANSFTAIGNDGMAVNALEDITGATEITTFSGTGAGWVAEVYNDLPENVPTYSGTGSSALALPIIVADVCAGNDVTLSSFTDAYLGNTGLQTLVSSHVFSVDGYDASTGMLELRNPWGVNAPATTLVNFEVSIDALLADGDFFTVDNMGTSTSVNDAPAIAARGLQLMSQIQSFTVEDSAANVQANRSELIRDTKLQSVIVDNPGGGAVALDLTGLSAVAVIDLGQNAAEAALSAFQKIGHPSLSLGTGYDSLSLGSGHAMIAFSQESTSQGVLSVQNFNSAYDALTFQLNGGALHQVIADHDGLGDYIYAGKSTQGVFLAGVTSTQAVSISGGAAYLT